MAFLEQLAAGITFDAITMHTHDIHGRKLTDPFKP